MRELGIAVVVFALNFAQIYLRTAQVYHVTERKVLASLITGLLICATWLISTWLGLKGIEQSSWLVVGSLVSSNGAAAAYAVWRTKAKDNK